MNIEKMARFITELRKSKNMTQKDLAEKLGITDKAVSKWERGLSSPDISLLPELSETLGVTIGELLSGERAETEVPAPVMNAVVETTLQYADTSTKNRSRKILNILGITFTVLSFLSILICMICDLALTEALTWSLYPLVSVIFAWFLIIPIFLWGLRGIVRSMIALTVLIIPYLFLLKCIIGGTDPIMAVGVPVSVISLVYMWIMYFMYAKTRLYVYAATAFALLLSTPFTWAVNYIVDRIVADSSRPMSLYIVNVMASIFSAGCILVIGLFIHHRILKPGERSL